MTSIFFQSIDVIHENYTEILLPPQPEMQKVGDTGDISLLFFLAGANFWAILGNFWAILAILSHFWAIKGNFRYFLGYFGSFFGHFLVLFFLAKNVSLLFLLLFASLPEGFWREEI